MDRDVCDRRFRSFRSFLAFFLPFQRSATCLTPVGGSTLEGRSHFENTKTIYDGDDETGQCGAPNVSTSTAEACGPPEIRLMQRGSNPRTIAVALGDIRDHLLCTSILLPPECRLNDDLHTNVCPLLLFFEESQPSGQSEHFLTLSGVRRC